MTAFRIVGHIGERRSSREETGMYDLVIRGATVVDGLGSEPRRADVAVKDSRIAAIGEVGSDAAEVIDAGGLSLMPGIIDGTRYCGLAKGPGQVLDSFLPTGLAAVRSAAN